MSDRFVIDTKKREQNKKQTSLIKMFVSSVEYSKVDMLGRETLYVVKELMTLWFMSNISIIFVCFIFVVVDINHF